MLEKSLSDQIREGVKEKSLTKLGWVEKLYPDLEEWHGLANLNALLGGLRKRGDYIFAVPMDGKFILKDVSENPEWFMYAYTNSVKNAEGGRDLILKMAQKFGATFPSWKGKAVKLAKIFVDSTVEKAEIELGIIYEPSLIRVK